MFRDGQYLEVIKASDNCLATVVVTVQEKTIEMKRKKVATNKWLDLEDWAAVYKILKRALLRNSQSDGQKPVQGCEWRKSTRQLEVTYSFEPPDCSKDPGASLPTIRVNVSPARKKSKEDSESSRSRSSDNADHDAGKKKSVAECVNGAERTSKRDKSERSHKASLEEYVPDAFPSVKKHCSELKYVPSKKSTLESMHVPSNEYTPTIADNMPNGDSPIPYVPNSLSTAYTMSYETYEPHSTGVANVDVAEEYVPSSKGVNHLIEEYQPDFTSKLMKFDDSYVPSKTTDRPSEENSKKSVSDGQSQRHELRRKTVLTNKEKTRLFS